MLKARLAVIATELGMPVAELAIALGKVFNQRCVYCELGAKVLKNWNVLGREKTVSLLSQILEAKKQQDLEKLHQLTEEFNGIRKS